MNLEPTGLYARQRALNEKMPNIDIHDLLMQSDVGGKQRRLNIDCHHRWQ